MKKDVNIQFRNENKEVIYSEVMGENGYIYMIITSIIGTMTIFSAIGWLVGYVVTGLTLSGFKKA